MPLERRVPPHVPLHAHLAPERLSAQVAFVGASHARLFRQMCVPVLQVLLAVAKVLAAGVAQIRPILECAVAL